MLVALGFRFGNHESSVILTPAFLVLNGLGKQCGDYRSLRMHNIATPLSRMSLRTVVQMMWRTWFFRIRLCPRVPALSQRTLAFSRDCVRRSHLYGHHVLLVLSDDDVRTCRHRCWVYSSGDPDTRRSAHFVLHDRRLVLTFPPLTAHVVVELAIIISKTCGVTIQRDIGKNIYNVNQPRRLVAAQLAHRPGR